MYYMVVQGSLAAGVPTLKHYMDTNYVVNPCIPLQQLEIGDAISVAVALGGNGALWYNKSDPNWTLSPCSANNAPVSFILNTSMNLAL